MMVLVRIAWVYVGNHLAWPAPQININKMPTDCSSVQFYLYLKPGLGYHLDLDLKKKLINFFSEMFRVDIKVFLLYLSMKIRAYWQDLIDNIS